MALFNRFSLNKKKGDSHHPQGHNQIEGALNSLQDALGNDLDEALTEYGKDTVAEVVGSLKATYVGLAVLPVMVASHLPDDYEAGTDDIAPYVQAAVDQAEARGHGHIQLPFGDHLWGTPVYLDSADLSITYVLGGHGKATNITLGSELDGDFALQVNIDSDGNRVVDSPNAKHPRLVVENVKINGDSSSDRSWVQVDKCCAVHRFVEWNDVKYGVYQRAGYSDLHKFETCHMRGNHADAWMFYMGGGNGDGYRFDGCIFGQDIGAAYLRASSGAVIDACIGGTWDMRSCRSVVVTAHHRDTTSVSETTRPTFILRDTHITFDRCWNHSLYGQPWIEINDADSSTDASHVIVDGCTLSNRKQSAVSDDRRGADIKLTSFLPRSQLILRNNRGAEWHDGAYVFDPAEIVVEADSAPIQTAIDARRHLLLGNCELRNINGTWALDALAPHSGLFTTKQLTNAASIVNISAQTGYLGDIANATTYYYAVAVYDGFGWTAGSAEDSQTASDDDTTFVLTVNAVHAPALIRVWRGTSTGTYDRYIDLPTPTSRTRIMDRGSLVNGREWITTAVPAVPTTNETLDGVVVHGRRMVWRGAAPTVGTWAVGDVCWSSSPAAGSPPGWVCVTAGTPGTWKAMASLAA